MGAGDLVSIDGAPPWASRLPGALAARKAHEIACVAAGACPDCGSDEWMPRPKHAPTVVCARCGATFSIEKANDIYFGGPRSGGM